MGEKEIPLVRSCRIVGEHTVCLTTVFVRWLKDVPDAMFVRMYAELWKEKELVRRWQYDSASLRVPRPRDLIREHEMATFIAIMTWNWFSVVRNVLSSRWPNEGDYDIPPPPADLPYSNDIFYHNLREVYERKPEVRDSAEG